jgi:phosphoserine aminotransferase
MEKPTTKPQNLSFSCGPCAKRPGWSFEGLENALLGRSHRSAPGKKKLKEVIDRHRKLLAIPEDYRVAVVPGSDTGAMEMSLWSLLGSRGVDVFAWETFGLAWLHDVVEQLKLENARTFKADYGELPDLSQADFNNDVVFTWNGTTSGVRVPDSEWIDADRKGLTICDATSAVFAYDLPWDKLDVITWSWQKMLGSEAAHGMLVLSPRAVDRLLNSPQPRPLPKIFRLVKNGNLLEEVFEGLTINTPSMMAVEDCIDALKWVESIGGLSTTMERSRANFKAIEEWVEKTDWVDFLASVPETRSITSVTLSITDPWFKSLPEDEQTSLVAAMCKTLDEEDAAKEIKSYRLAPLGIRIWGGATVESEDVKALMPWIEWAYLSLRSEKQQKAA